MNADVFGVHPGLLDAAQAAGSTQLRPCQPMSTESLELLLQGTGTGSNIALAAKPQAAQDLALVCFER